MTTDLFAPAQVNIDSILTMARFRREAENEGMGRKAIGYAERIESAGMYLDARARLYPCNDGVVGDLAASYLDLNPNPFTPGEMARATALTVYKTTLRSDDAYLALYILFDGKGQQVAYRQVTSR